MKDEVIKDYLIAFIVNFTLIYSYIISKIFPEFDYTQNVYSQLGNIGTNTFILFEILLIFLAISFIILSIFSNRWDGFCSFIMGIGFIFIAIPTVSEIIEYKIKLHIIGQFLFFFSFVSYIFILNWNKKKELLIKISILFTFFFIQLGFYLNASEIGLSISQKLSLAVIFLMLNFEIRNMFIRSIFLFSGGCIVICIFLSYLINLSNIIHVIILSGILLIIGSLLIYKYNREQWMIVFLFFIIALILIFTMLMIFILSISNPYVIKEYILGFIAKVSFIYSLFFVIFLELKIILSKLDKKYGFLVIFSLFILLFCFNWEILRSMDLIILIQISVLIIIFIINERIINFIIQKNESIEYIIEKG